MACPAPQILADPMTPGSYLRKRREAAGLGLRQAAASLAVLAVGLGLARPVRADGTTVARLALRLSQAEEDGLPFPTAQAEYLASVIPLDAQIYSQLVALHYAGPTAQGRNDAGGLIDLPIPHICSNCACSWHVACVDDRGPCSWSSREPDLCTACERKATAAAELESPGARLTLVAGNGTEPGQGEAARSRTDEVGTTANARRPDRPKPSSAGSEAEPTKAGQPLRPASEGQTEEFA